jgi:hypothetical protein
MPGTRRARIVSEVVVEDKLPLCEANAIGSAGIANVHICKTMTFARGGADQTCSRVISLENFIQAFNGVSNRTLIYDNILE